MKISEYPEIQEITDENTLLIVDSPSGGTQTIKTSNFVGKKDEEETIFAEPVWVAHRNTYRGKNLGSEFTPEQKYAISSGTFDDLYVGDYWEIEGSNWRIADVNYWLNTGNRQNNNETTVNHLVIVPDKSLYNARMNDSATTNGGYAGSKMYSSGLTTALTTVKRIFGSNNILSHQACITGAASNGIATSNVWANVEVILMNEPMLFGSPLVGAMNTGSQYNWNMSNVDKSQLAVFRFRPDLMCGSKYGEYAGGYWLRDIVTSKCFVYMYCTGNVVGNLEASQEYGVRPVFGIIG